MLFFGVCFFLYFIKLSASKSFYPFSILGLYAAAFDLGIEWVVVKGVSDFADGNKTATGNWQPFASAMAASVVHNMFKYSDVIESWPHYQKTAPATSTAGNKQDSGDGRSTLGKLICILNQGWQIVFKHFFFNLL